MKEWYFFDEAGLGNNLSQYGSYPASKDSVLFGVIASGTYHWLYKYTHKQGFIKKVKFNGLDGNINFRDFCLDSVNKFIYSFCRTGPRAPFYKYVQGIVYKLDLNLNLIDSSIISYSTIYEPTQISYKNNKLYLLASNRNYFSEPIKINLTILNTNLQLLNRKVVSDSVNNSCYSSKMFFDNNNNLRLYVWAAANGSVFPKSIRTIDTNLNFISDGCIINRCPPWYTTYYPENIIKTKSGYIYTSEQNPFAQWPQYHVYYHFKVTENEDTLKTTYFYTKSVPSNQYYPTKYNYNIRHLQSIKNNYLLGLGSEEIFGSTSINQNNYKFLIIDSSLNIINTFDVLKFTTAKLDLITAGKTKIGQTPSGMYYISSQAKDSTQVNYKGVYYLMTIDSTAKISTNPSPTITATEQEWQNINIYPNPTKDIVKFAIPPNTNYNVNVYNNLGQLLMSINDVNVNREINLQGLPIGIYHFTFYETNLKKNITKKLVLE